MLAMSKMFLRPVSRISRFGTIYQVTSGDSTWTSFTSAGHPAGRVIKPMRHEGEMIQMEALVPLRGTLKPKGLLNHLRGLGLDINYRDSSRLTPKKINANLKSYCKKEMAIARM
jgi:hypothetical protein